ncbi:HAMP domain-containing sensor histidine kinase [Bacillus sp. V2I10]|uniref:HAMP domain-containing sensor histidine kinase n=1 Tax=Bacillus sp. V2I10 TaxID=3042276 RepID=UPI002787C288|nr:HAMP domain-containing sensor histidine kinase [Bacillus sp. V2I10]MDQ0859618.1 two-component system sporulation sensor kinase B [Bacillus sp. V2I10]
MSKVLNTGVIWLGIALMSLSISMSQWFNSEKIGLGTLIKNMEQNPSGDSLLIIAFLLVTLNTIRALPFYLGAFLVGDQIGERLQQNWPKIAIPLILIPLRYIIINVSYETKFHFGSPALILLFSIFLLQRLGKGRLNLLMKSIILAQVLFGLQWLDEVPFLTAYGFGHGAISTQVKQWAVQIGFVQSLSLYGLVLCSIFLINSVILTNYLVKWRISQDLHLVKLKALEARSDREVLNLVHDLKTPLTSIEGLISLIEIRIQDGKTKEYCQKISISIRAMNEMISEILYESRKRWCSLKELIDYVHASRLSSTNTKVNFELPDKYENIQLRINKIRMTRAMVNLINNAFDAIEGQAEGKVTIQAKVYDKQVWFGVSDNGIGMTEEEKEKVWKAGYSTKQHPGIGLSFVQQVAEGHEGTVFIESKIGKGTTVWIRLVGGNNNESVNY